MRRDIGNELIVALFAVLALLFALVFALLLTTATRIPPSPTTTVVSSPALSETETLLLTASATGVATDAPTEIPALVSVAPTDDFDELARTLTAAATRRILTPAQATDTTLAEFELSTALPTADVTSIATVVQTEAAPTTASPALQETLPATELATSTSTVRATLEQTILVRETDAAIGDSIAPIAANGYLRRKRHGVSYNTCSRRYCHANVSCQCNVRGDRTRN